MIRPAFVYLSILFLVLPSAGGAEPAAPSSSETDNMAVAKIPGKATVPVPRKCELTYEVSSEVVTVPITSVDPELFKQEYVAEFVMNIPRLPSSLEQEYTVPHGVGPDPSKRPNILSLYMLLGGDSIPEPGCSAFLNLIPEEHRPPDELAKALDPPFFAVTSRTMDIERFQTLVTYRLFAPTPERAKQLVETQLCLYGYGLSCPALAECLREKKAESEKLAAYRVKLKELEDVAAEYDRELERSKEYADVTPETLLSLRTQQRVLEVDRAGVEARIAACTRVLEGQVVVKRQAAFEHVETMKIAAEIELVGLEAKQRAISRIIKNGKAYVALREKEQKNAGQVEQLRSSKIHDTQRMVDWYAGRLETWSRCPIKDAKVVIRPVKFVPANE